MGVFMELHSNISNLFNISTAYFPSEEAKVKEDPLWALGSPRLWAQVLDAFDTSRLAAGKRLVLVLQSRDVRRGDRA
jgi:hypothetical protein